VAEIARDREVCVPGREVEEIRSNLDAAFADFKSQNPELANALEVLNISYNEYLSLLMGLNGEFQTISGNALDA